MSAKIETEFKATGEVVIHQKGRTIVLTREQALTLAKAIVVKMM